MDEHSAKAGMKVLEVGTGGQIFPPDVVRVVVGCHLNGWTGRKPEYLHIQVLYTESPRLHTFIMT